MSKAHLMARCRPLGDRVVVKTDKVATRTKGGIVLPDSVVEGKKPFKGTVIAVGDGKKLDQVAGDAHTGVTAARVPMDVNIGDVVLFVQYAGMVLQDSDADHEDHEYVLLREEDIVATLPEEGDDA